MRTLTKEEILREKWKLVLDLRKCVFIHPTDTIYGLGCNATDRKLVNKVRKLKKQYTRPISVIAPNIGWIEENCEINDETSSWLEKLPGPYTLIMKLKKPSCVARTVHLGTSTLGVRMPRHWFSEVVSDMNVPTLTTSVNSTGERFMRDFDLLDDSFKKTVQIFIDEGVIEGKPSKIVDLTKKEALILRN